MIPTGFLIAGAAIAGLVIGPAAIEPLIEPTIAPLDEAGWHQILARTAEATTTTPYVGQTMWVDWSGGSPEITLFDVSNLDGQMTSSADPYTMRLSAAGSGLDDVRQGWSLDLPATSQAEVDDLLTALDEKYTVSVGEPSELLDRPCTQLEIRRRVDGDLAERLWIDEDSGLLLRRETYTDGQRIRMAVFASLDLDPSRGVRAAVERRDSRAKPMFAALEHSAEPVGEQGLDVLRASGWDVPQTLPGDYKPLGAFAVAAGEGQPLQVVYSDGLYTLSLFQQPGSPDWTSLPAGAHESDAVGFTAYDWPGATPARMVWDGGMTTWSLVGDAPPDEFLAVAQSLPREAAPGLGQRLSRGLRRLWSWVSPWS